MVKRSSRLLPPAAAFLFGTLCSGLGPAIAGADDRLNLAESDPSIAQPQTVVQPSVNNPAADTTARNTQAGPALVDLGGGKLVAAWYDSGSFDPTKPLKQHYVGYAYSSNFGATWTDAGRLPDFLPPNQQEGDDLFTQPALAAYRAGGAVYLATTNRTSPQDILVFKSTDAGHTFHAPVSGSPGTPSGFDLRSKPRIAVDNFAGSGAGNVYLCFSRFPTSGNAEIRFSRSLNAGSSFAPNFGLRIAAGGPGCAVAVSPAHAVSVFYIRGTGAAGQGGDNRLFVRRSLDRGATFRPEAMVADLRTTTVQGDLGLDANLQSNSFPQVAVNPVAAKPYLYLFFNDDKVSGDADHGDVFYVFSKDAGATWSAPKPLNDEPAGDQFDPSAAFIDAGGRILASYYSCSHDPNGHACHRRARAGMLDANGFIVWYPSFQIGPDAPLGVTDDPDFFNPGHAWFGDYDQAAGGAGAVSLVWSDNRVRAANGKRNTDVYFARIPLPMASTNLSLTASAAASKISLGGATTLTLTAKALSGPANDLMLHVSPVLGLGYLAVTPPPGGSCVLAAQFLDCDLGTLAAGASKSVRILTAGGYAPGKRIASVTATTSSRDSTPSSAAPIGAPADAASAGITTTLPAGALTHMFTAPGLPITVEPGTFEAILLPITVTGTVFRVTAYVRLDHPQDGEILLALGRGGPGSGVLESVLSRYQGGFRPDYGTGANDCAGKKTAFDDGAPGSIYQGAPPFLGAFRPVESLAVFERRALNKTWALGIDNKSSSQAAVVGCFQLRISYVPS